MIEKLNPNSTNNTDSSYESKMNDEVIPYFNQGTQNFFEGLGGIQICYHEIIRGSKNAIVMLPGRTEPFLKYSENTVNLVQERFLLENQMKKIIGMYQDISITHKNHN